VLIQKLWATLIFISWIIMITQLSFGGEGELSLKDKETPQEATSQIQLHPQGEGFLLGPVLPSIHAACTAPGGSYCDTCSISCPEGKAANCEAGKVECPSTDPRFCRCVKQPPCYCGLKKS